MRRTPTNFDLYLQDQLRDPDFAAHFEAAGQTGDIALQNQEDIYLARQRLERPGKTYSAQEVKHELGL